MPEGTICHMIIFSLNPSRGSVLPVAAASVRTLVVSWKDAAEIKLDVLSPAFVIP